MTHDPNGIHYAELTHIAMHNWPMFNILKRLIEREHYKEAEILIGIVIRFI